MQVAEAFMLSVLLYCSCAVARAAAIEQSAKTDLSEDDICSPLCSSCGTCHCNANIGFLQSRRIVHPITCTCQRCLFITIQVRMKDLNAIQSEWKAGWFQGQLAEQPQASVPTTPKQSKSACMTKKSNCPMTTWSVSRRLPQQIMMPPCQRNW